MPQASPSWAGTPSIKGSTESMRMMLLTSCLIGLQFTWGIEMTYCTPYLLQLGLTKSKLSLVWIAGPLSGLLMQPIVGILADRSTLKWGRRRPFMLGGAAIVGLCLLLLGWTKEIVGFFVQDKEMRNSVTIALAVLSIYAVDFAINAVQASCRSLIVDTLPISKQHMGASWASRMVGVGSLIGYAAGAADLKSILGPAFGDSQFKQLTAVAAIIFCSTVGITCYAVTERVLISDKHDGKSGPFDMLTQILHTATNLPRRIAAICWITFWAWIGWFPFLFYSTTWVGEIYVRYDASEAEESGNSLDTIGRVGSMSLIVFSIVSFAASISLPWFVKSPEEETANFTPRPPANLAPLVLELEKYRPTLLSAWTLSHILFACGMILAPFVASFRAATILVAMCGIPWAITCWAPMAFMGIEINKLGSSSTNVQVYSQAPRDSIELEAADRGVLRVHHHPDEPHSPTGELSGVYLGILNLYTTLPQFVGTFISWVVFSILEPGKSPELATEARPDEHHSRDGPNGIAVCLFIGALSALGAAYATSRLRYIA